MIASRRASFTSITNIDKIFIGGDVLKKNVSDHLTKLNKFMFNIRSIVSLSNQINLRSNE